MGRVSVPTIDGVPVLLPAHDHPEFGDPGRHYHVDYRYCPDEPLQHRVIFSEAEPVLAELEEVRPGGYLIKSGAIRVAIYLAQHYRGERSHCGKCPHKGLPVYEGVCAGHGLAFDGEGRVIRAAELRLRCGPAVLPVAPGFLVYTFVMPARGEAAGVELLNPAGKVIAAAALQSGAIPFEKGDQITISIP